MQNKRLPARPHNSKPWSARAVLLTLLRFSCLVVDAELEPECDLLLPWALLALEEEEEEEEVEEGTAGGVLLRWEDAEWDGRLCDVEDDDDDDTGFFFFLTDVGASYVRNDSKDMVGVSKSSSSLAEESFDACGFPMKNKNNKKQIKKRVKSGDDK